MGFPEKSIARAVGIDDQGRLCDRLAQKSDRNIAAAGQHQRVHPAQIDRMQSSVMHRKMRITVEYQIEPMFVALANPRSDTRHF
jgi:hypothetical protein